MTSKTSIASNALILVGDRYIDSLTEDSDRARIVNALYDYSRDAVIRANMWGCCTKRVVLAPMTDLPAFEWGYQFQLPADCLRVVAVDFDGFFLDYRVEGGKILCNRNVVYLRYLYRNDDPLTYDAGFVDVFTAKLAALIAYPITRSTAVQAQMEGLYLQRLRVARAADGQEGVTDTIGDSPLVQCR